MQTQNLYFILMAGGSGTRLWPLSRKKKPKQFLKTGSELSLVRETALRLIPPVDWKNILIVCGETHAALMKKSFPELNDRQFLLEPCGRNTAAAIALAAYTLLQSDPDAILVVSPADQKIHAEDLKLFRETILSAAHFCREKGGLITLGIKPGFPATGYGYVQSGKKIQEGKYPVCEVKQFREKPDFKTAQKYLEEKSYFWNSGIFIWKAADYWKAYQKFLPQDAKAFEQGFPRVDEFYPRLTSISVDYAILEKAESVLMIEVPFRWDDVGSLSSLHPYFPHDQNQNAVSGDVVILDSKNNLILSDEGLVACLGVENLVVVKSGDAVLVISRERSEEVKLLLEEIKKNKLESYL